MAKTFRQLVAAERQALREGKTRSESLRAAFDCFYRGEIAKQFVSFFRENGGLFTGEDFARYKPIWTEPIHTKYRGFDIYTSPATSRGGLEVVMQLNVIEGYDLQKLGHNSPESLHLVAECIKLAKSDIYHFVADPKFTDIPTEGMISKQYAASRRGKIDLERAAAFPAHGNPPRSRQANAGPLRKRLPLEHRPQYPEQSYEGCTTSFSVADQFGNVVVCTPTLGSAWGKGGRFLINGATDDPEPTRSCRREPDG